jgi:hypothetical protein
MLNQRRERYKVKKVMALIIFPLFIGIAIYAVFRDNDLMIYSWIPSLNSAKNVIDANVSIPALHPVIKDFIVFSLPDGLWLYAFTGFMILIWNKSDSRFKYVWMNIGGIIALCHEVGQGLGLFPGTFDIIDIIVYLTAIPIAFLVLKKCFKEVNSL